MNDEIKAKLEKYMLETGYYDTRAIRKDEGQDDKSAGFWAIFGDSDDQQENEKSELLQAAEEFNNAKLSSEKTPEPITETVIVETLNTQTSEWESETIERPVTLSCDDEIEIDGITFEARYNGHTGTLDLMIFGGYAEDELQGGWYEMDDFEVDSIEVPDEIEDYDDMEIAITKEAIERAKAYRAQYPAEMPDETPEELKAVMTSAEIAEEFGVAEITVRQAIYRQTLFARQSGKTWLVRREDRVRSPLS